MGMFAFKGGIHPEDQKMLSKDRPIQRLTPKGELVYLLSQHIGAPAVSVVTVGEKVKKGQVLAKQNGFVSAAVHASVSGAVTAIEPRRNVMGQEVEAIVVQQEEADEKNEGCMEKPLENMTKEEILKRISESGIVGMGGAGFPTHVKLSPKEPEKIEYIIANGAECEPYITADYRRMLETPEELVEGMEVVLRLFDKAEGIFAVEDNKKDCAKRLEELVREKPRMKVMVLPTRYPQGAERQLIYATTKRSLDSGRLPADVGCIVDNVETLVAIYHAVKRGRPLVERVVTVSGDNVTNPGNFLVPIGINHQELLQAAGGFAGEGKKLISGGPMMGIAMVTADLPVTKTSSCLLCMKDDPVADKKESACINCGRCVMVCPSRIVPSKLADYAELEVAEEFEKWHGMECIECGSCSYVCPAKRHLKQIIADQKKILIARKRRKEG